MTGVPFENYSRVRVGVWGAGHRGRLLAELLTRTAGAELVAVVDPSAVNLAAVREKLGDAGRSVAFMEIGGTEVEPVLERVELDLVVVATPWHLHRPLAVAAMRAGKHVAVEVSPAQSLEDCWQLVEVSEETRRHCMLLENCSYGYNELMVLRMIRAGLFGQLLHAEAGYLHDLRHALLTSHGWRRSMHAKFDGNLYPTHGLGPVAGYLDINRGDRFVQIVSMSSPQIGLELMRDEMVGGDDPMRNERWIAGDVNTSLLKTARGRTVMLQHQVVGPRPYDRLNSVVGTAGVFRDFPARFYLEREEAARGLEEVGYDAYVGAESYAAEYQHWLWSRPVQPVDAHGGMDTLMLERLIGAMTSGTVPDIDVYDAATWTAPTVLSHASVSAGSSPVEFPDFTRGAWRHPRPGIP